MPDNISPDCVTFLALCGGAGVRMQGLDKPLQRWRDTSLVDAVLATAHADMPKLISANRNLDAYRQRAPTVTDAAAGVTSRSPLTGVLAAFSACETEWLLSTPGDTPLLPARWYEPLAIAAAAGHHAAVAHDGERQQHLHLILHRDLAGPLRDYLQADHHQVWRWLADIEAVSVRCASPHAFTNVNTLQELRASE